MTAGVGGDLEMVDAMLYADLDLDVKLSDALSSFKDFQKMPTIAAE